MSGQGYLMDYNDVPPSIQNDIEEDYLKQVLELSLNEMVESIKNNLPQEPIEGDSSGLNIIIKDEDKTYNRRFNKSDKIRDIKNYLVTKKRTFNEIEIYENIPKKVYSNDESTLEEAGIVNNCVIMARVIQ